MLYADGLAFYESKSKSTQLFEYHPDIRQDTFTVWSCYVIPGSGTDHPVQPGHSMLIVDTGIDHRTAFTIGNTTIEANEVEGWDGDTQKSVGGLFLIKLDKDGNYLANVKADGKAAHERILNMRFVNNQLYFIGVMTGDGKGTSVSLDGKSTAAHTRASCLAVSTKILPPTGSSSIRLHLVEAP